MATGIVSIAASLLGMPLVARALLAVNLAAYACLGLLLAARLLFYFGRVLADLRDHSRGPGFFTVVAGTCVLGSQLLVVNGLAGAARALWFAGIALWVVVMYGFFTATIVRERKPSLEDGINGAWLIATVATQSVSVLGTMLAPGFEAGRAVVLFFALCMYLLGAMLYLSIITLIFYRFTFLELSMEQLTPPYWINMGAVAITTLAGSTLILSGDASALVGMLRPFLVGFTLFFWSAATWWIPLLLLLGIWRHVVRRYPLTLRPAVLGDGLPAGHVHRLHVAAGGRGGRRVPADHPGWLRLRRARGVGGHLRGHAPASGPRAGRPGAGGDVTAPCDHGSGRILTLRNQNTLPWSWIAIRPVFAFP